MTPSPVTRRAVLQSIAGGGAAAALAACAPAAAPAPVPAAPAAPASAAVPAWQKDWDALVAAAKQEGKLTLVTAPGTAYAKSVAAFEAAFPGIKVEHAQGNATAIAPKALEEAKAGVHSFDVITTTHATAGASLYKGEIMDPVRPLLFRPDAIDNAVWRGGFEAGFIDPDKSFTYSAFSVLAGYLWINTDLVKEEEVRTMDDLLKPQWKGKIISGDPRGFGGGSVPASAVRLKYGDEMITKLWKNQEPVLSRDGRQITENLVRGRYPIAIGVTQVFVDQFLSEGVGKNLKMIEAIPEFMSVAGSQDVLYIFKRRPHPNAAKLFANWFLTREAQTLWGVNGSNNSRRIDVPAAVPVLMPKPGVSYFAYDTAAGIAAIAETYAIAQKVIT